MLNRLNYKLVGYPFHVHRFIRSQPALTPFTNQDLPPGGDTLFLLGTGRSIQELQAPEWDHIERHTSFALNFFALHSHIPSLYFYEPRPHHFAHYLRVMEEKHPNEARRVLVNASHFDFFNPEDFPRVPETFRFYAPLVFRSIWSGIYPFWFKVLPAWAKHKSSLLSWAVHMSGSMTIPLTLAVYMGFKKIVMAGVDLTGCGHFYYDDPDPLARETVEIEEGLYREENADAQNKAVHITDDPRNRYPMRQVLEDLYTYMLLPRGIELFVSSSSSRLSDRFPVYSFKDEVKS